MCLPDALTGLEPAFFPANHDVRETAAAAAPAAGSRGEGPHGFAEALSGCSSNSYRSGIFAQSIDALHFAVHADCRAP